MAKKDVSSTNIEANQNKISNLLDKIYMERDKIDGVKQHNLNMFIKARSLEIEHLKARVMRYQRELAIENSYAIQKYKKELFENSNIANLINRVVKTITTQITK